MQVIVSARLLALSLYNIARANVLTLIEIPHTLWRNPPERGRRILVFIYFLFLFLLVRRTQSTRDTNEVFSQVGKKLSISDDESSVFMSPVEALNYVWSIML